MTHLVYDLLSSSKKLVVLTILDKKFRVFFYWWICFFVRRDVLQIKTKQGFVPHLRRVYGIEAPEV
jgi:hypothetical protein